MIEPQIGFDTLAHRKMNFLDVRLATDRLRLRPIGDADASALLGIFGDAEVMRYWSTPPWTSQEQAQTWIESDMRAMQSQEHLRLAIEDAAGGDLIGTCTLFAWSRTCRRAEIGYVLARAAWGRSFATEAAHALIDFGFDHMNLNRIEADIDPRNAGSVRVLDALGFVREGLLRERWIVEGQVSDSALYGLLAADWRCRSQGLLRS